jgi:hypothetical protein
MKSLAMFARAERSYRRLMKSTMDADRKNRATFGTGASRAAGPSAWRCTLITSSARGGQVLHFQSGRFSEVLFVDRVQNDATILRNYPTAFDLWLNTTNPADVSLRDRVRRDEGVSMAQAIRLCAERYPQGAPR